MSWSRVFICQDYNRPTYKHIDFPLYETDEFDFFRCVGFHESFYEKTASELFNGNLRVTTGRYSSLFPGKKLSYWANSAETARKEVEKYGIKGSMLTFWAYDDASSTFPTLSTERAGLLIVDGRKAGLQDVIEKLNSGEEITSSERNAFDEIMQYNPDCIAYDSHASPGGECFLFFESGFKKLSMRELRLNLDKKSGGSHNVITCADNSDYTPFIEAYGEFFVPKAKIKMDDTYQLSDEYKERNKILGYFLNEIRKSYN